MPSVHVSWLPRNFKIYFRPSSRIHEHSFADMRMGIKSKVLLSFTSSAGRAQRKPKCRWSADLKSFIVHEDSYDSAKSFVSFSDEMGLTVQRLWGWIFLNVQSSRRLRTRTLSTVENWDSEKEGTRWFFFKIITQTMNEMRFYTHRIILSKNLVSSHIRKQIIRNYY